MEPVSARPLTRGRTLLGLGGAGVVGALGLTGCSSAPTSSAQQADGAQAARVTADSTGVFDGEDRERTLVVVPFGTRLPLLEQGEKASRVLLPNERAGWMPLRT